VSFRGEQYSPSAPANCGAANSGRQRETAESSLASSSPPDAPAVLALDATSGTIRWTHQFTSPLLDGAPPNVAVGDQRVYAALTLGPQGPSANGPSGELVELSAQTGGEAWLASLPGPTRWLVGDATALYVSTEAVGSAIKEGQPGTTLAAYQPSDGKQLWSVPIASPDLSIVASVNGSLIVTGSAVGMPGSSGPTGGFVEAVRASDSSTRWKVETSGGGGAHWCARSERLRGELMRRRRIVRVPTKTKLAMVARSASGFWSKSASHCASHSADCLWCACLMPGTLVACTASCHEPASSGAPRACGQSPPADQQ
jgi:hypothetical protein